MKPLWPTIMFYIPFRSYILFYFSFLEKNNSLIVLYYIEEIIGVTFCSRYQRIIPEMCAHSYMSCHVQCIRIDTHIILYYC